MNRAENLFQTMRDTVEMGLVQADVAHAPQIETMRTEWTGFDERGTDEHGGTRAAVVVCLRSRHVEWVIVFFRVHVGAGCGAEAVHRGSILSPTNWG